VAVAELNPIRLVYIAVFALTAMVCFGAITRARRQLEDPDTRWGLVSLLATSGLWASFLVGRFVVPIQELKIAFYILGLVTGLASVGAWLYFCSAYAGKPYHKRRSFRVVAVVIFLAICSVKLTSPIHGLYFSTKFVAVPFQRLIIRFGILHWVVTGVVYALSAIGFYILFDLFQDSNYATTRLGMLVGLAGVPVIVDVIAYTNPQTLLTLNYEPVGVGLFALGVLYVADGSFIAVQRFGREQLLDELEEGVLLIDDNNVIRDVNETAKRLFPALADSIGTPVTAALPEVVESVPLEDSQVIRVGDSDASQYYLLSTTQLEAGQTRIGQALVFTDITQVENQRQELKRHRSQLDDFAEAITHELRNTIHIIQQHLELIEMELDSETDQTVQESITTSVETTNRMSDIVSNLAMLARYGNTVDVTTAVEVEEVASEAFSTVATEDHRLEITAGTLETDRSHLYRLLENLFRFAIENGGTHVELTQTDGELVMISDGDSLKGVDTGKIFDYGEAVPNAESVFEL
jgi:signal transduction histidine kinase